MAPSVHFFLTWSLVWPLRIHFSVFSESLQTLLFEVQTPPSLGRAPYPSSMLLQHDPEHQTTFPSTAQDGPLPRIKLKPWNSPQIHSACLPPALTLHPSCSPSWLRPCCPLLQPLGLTDCRLFLVNANTLPPWLCPGVGSTWNDPLPVLRMPRRLLSAVLLREMVHGLLILVPFTFVCEFLRLFFKIGKLN